MSATTVAPERSAASVRPSFLTVLGELLVSAGCLVLLFVAWQLWWTDVEAGQDAQKITSGLEATWDAASATSGTGSGPAEKPIVIPGNAFAVITIPAFGSDWRWPILEGTDHETLKKGMGHYPKTAMPGEIGNMAVAGHRTTYGRPMHDVQKLKDGDPIVITTATSVYTYRVSKTLIVAPSQGQVALANPDDPNAPPADAMLTITTCHPAYSARERYVVHAILDTTTPRLATAAAPTK